VVIILHETALLVSYNTKNLVDAQCLSVLLTL